MENPRSVLTLRPFRPFRAPWEEGEPRTARWERKTHEPETDGWWNLKRCCVPLGKPQDTKEKSAPSKKTQIPNHRTSPTPKKSPKRTALPNNEHTGSTAVGVVERLGYFFKKTRSKFPFRALPERGPLRQCILTKCLALKLVELDEKAGPPNVSATRGDKGAPTCSIPFWALGKQVGLFRPCTKT